MKVTLKFDGISLECEVPSIPNVNDEVINEDYPGDNYVVTRRTFHVYTINNGKLTVGETVVHLKKKSV